MRKTPAQRAGWKVGDRGVVNQPHPVFGKGSLVKLIEDRGNNALFSLVEGTSAMAVHEGYVSYRFVDRRPEYIVMPLLQRLRTYILGIDPQTLAYAREIAARDSGKRKHVAEALLKVSGG